MHGWKFRYSAEGEVAVQTLGMPGWMFVGESGCPARGWKGGEVAGEW